MGFNPFEQIGFAAADAGKFLQDRGNDIAKAASEGANAVAKGQLKALTPLRKLPAKVRKLPRRQSLAERTRLRKPPPRGLMLP